MTRHGDLVALGIASSRFSEVVDLIQSDQWVNETPCDDWTVRDLVDHVIGGHVFTAVIVDGASADAAMAEAIEVVSVPEIQPVERPASERQTVAFSKPGALDRSCHHVVGELPASQVLRLRVHEIAIHGWDLDIALGGAGVLPEALVDWSLAELALADSRTAAHVEAPAAPNQIALLHAFGRGTEAQG